MDIQAILLNPLLDALLLVLTGSFIPGLFSFLMDKFNNWKYRDYLQYAGLLYDFVDSQMKLDFPLEDRLKEALVAVSDGKVDPDEEKEAIEFLNNVIVSKFSAEAAIAKVK